MKTRLILGTSAVWLTALVAASPTPAMHRDMKWQFAIAMSCPGHRAGIAYYKRRAHRYESRLGLPRTTAVQGERAVGNCEEAIPVVARWRNLAARREKQYATLPHRPPHYRQWLCIHHYEGAWNDPSPPYYGGLQMDLSFQQAHAPKLLASKGTADNWTPLEQMWAAEDAYRTSGFHPWPTTARKCGLI